MKLKLCNKITFLIILFYMTLASFSYAHAWSAYTHAAITAEAFSKYSFLMPGAVFSSSLPDVTTNFISPASKDELYLVFHGEKFRQAACSLLNKLDKNKDGETFRAIYGYLSHVTADEVAHAETGYPNLKHTFNVKKELDHYVAYLFMDMLCYYEYFGGPAPSFGKFVPDVDARMAKLTLDEYNSIFSTSVQFDEINFLKKETLFKAGIAIQKAIFDIIINGDPELFEQIRSFYSDYAIGVAGAGGLFEAINELESKISAGEYFSISTNSVSAFLNKEKNDITYIGMQITSKLAQDSEFIRTGSLSSGAIEKLVNSFFESKSESSKSMGKFLSALLLKKGMLYEEIIAYVDGQPENKNSESYLKYKTAFKNLKQSRWYSFIPGSRAAETRRYYDAFKRYRLEELESELEAIPCIGAAEKKVVIAAETQRLDACGKLYSQQSLNPLTRAKNRAENDAAFMSANFITGYIKSAAKFKAANDRASLKKLAACAEKFNEKMTKIESAAKKISAADYIFSPLQCAYKKSFAQLSPKNKIAAAEAIKISCDASGLDTSSAIDSLSSEAENNGVINAAEPKNLSESYELMKTAYEDYTNYLEKLKDYPAMTDNEKKILDAKQKLYLFYSEIYKSFGSDSKSSKNN